MTTFTEANEAEIRKKIVEKNKFIPSNITVQTWFSTLLQHGIRPYQGCLFDHDIKGMNLVSGRSAPYAVRRATLKSTILTGNIRSTRIKYQSFSSNVTRQAMGKS